MSQAASAPAVKTSLDRLREKQAPAKAESELELSFLLKMRSYVDALMFAFLLAMFIRSFVFELFMIPTGSMTPTLIGDSAGEQLFADYDDDGVQDVVYTFRYGKQYQNSLQVYLLNSDGSIKEQLFLDGINPQVAAQLGQNSRRRTDMIIVNKFSYWFSGPQRGDIAVFKVPHRPQFSSPFDPTRPVYIKRTVGLPGEAITIPTCGITEVPLTDPARVSRKWGGTEIRLNPKPIEVNGAPIADGSLLNVVHFPRSDNPKRYPLPTDPESQVRVPDDSVLMLGDNAASSSDGRYWGAVPLSHFRGRAIVRYWPFKAFGFLK